jgi:hypothetical protein
MPEITLPLNEKRSPREEDAANRLLVAALFGKHEEIERRLKSTIIQRMLKRGELRDFKEVMMPWWRRWL